MKQNLLKRSGLFAMLLISSLGAFAQTANNDDVTVTWALTSGTAEDGKFAPETASQFFTASNMTLGSGVKIGAESKVSTTPVVTTYDGYTQTGFIASKSGDNTIDFTLTPKAGIAFTPTEVGLKCERWLTDKGNVEISWVSADGSTKSLGSFRPNRNYNEETASGDKTSSIVTYEINGATANEALCYLRVTISGMDGKKTISIGDVYIKGTVKGTVGQAIQYTLTVKAEPAEGGTVSVSPKQDKYDSGSSVTLSQTANEGWHFLGWYNDGAMLSSASEYKFNIKGDMNVVAKYQSTASLLKGDYIVVDNIAALRQAIKDVNASTDGQRKFIFLKNGTYDYGTYHNPESGSTPFGRDSIKVDNVSLIGQSKAGVTIQIEPEMASVSRTAPIVNYSTGNYYQDITFKNNFSYGGNDGQAAAFMDKGDKTIMKNVNLISKQDTYYPNTDMGRIYVETSRIDGTVDYICGRGDVFFEGDTLNCVQRYKNPWQGNDNISAPYTIGKEFNSQGGHGFIFNNCFVNNEVQYWTFSRGWRGYPKAAFLNTRLSNAAAMRCGENSKELSNKYTTYPKDTKGRLSGGGKGIQSSSDAHAMEFYEYNTTDSTGTIVLNPESNIMTTTASDSRTAETILKATELDRFQLANVFPGWSPAEDAKQVIVTKVDAEGTTLTWTTNTTAKAFLIEADGNFVEIVDGTNNSYTIPAGTPGSKYTVRAANMMGGFGPACPAGGVINAIDKTLQAKDVQSIRYYNISGVELSQPQKGLNIIVKTMTDGTRTSTKVIF